MKIPFLHSGIYEGDVVDLIVERKESAGYRNRHVETIYYEIRQHLGGMRVGECDLRVGMNEELFYAGNIGYRIYGGYRGHHYAYEACLLLFQIAKEKYYMNELIITCSPDNIASHKTLERLNGKLEDVVSVPSWHWLYRRGEKEKEIFRYKL